MLTNVKSMSLNGIEGQIINVEVDISNGLPSWEIVGLPDASVRESKERVRTAIKNSGYELNSRKFVINLAPASTKKEGSSYDLAIAIGILKNLRLIEKESLDEYIFIGELSLNGNLNRINGVLSMCIAAQNVDVKNIIIPFDNKDEAGVIKGLNIYPAKSLNDVVMHLNESKKIKRYLKEGSFFIENNLTDDIDFLDIKGQVFAKRALEIVAAGGHDCLMIGSPGSGKTMLAKRLKTILPDLDFEEAIETTKIYSVAGLLTNESPLINKRPFRAPHHTISKIALVGGGKSLKPGEMSLAHNGVLYLDEIAEFDRSTLEAIRTPIEEKSITISRMKFNVTLPSDFIFIASMNPCPCGYSLDEKHECNCTSTQILKYRNKISGPLLDRIDIHLEVKNIEYRELTNNNCGESSKIIKNRVLHAREIQNNRYKEYGIKLNSELTEKLISRFCKLDDVSNKFLEKAFEKYNFSARAINKILKTARTIADLEESENIELAHLSEAIQYRKWDKI